MEKLLSGNIPPATLRQRTFSTFINSLCLSAPFKAMRKVRKGMVFIMENNNFWGRGFTAKRYLHPPFAEKIITMWPNAKVVIGSIYGSGDTQPPSHGFRILFGNPASGLDRCEVRYKKRFDGVPIHAIEHRLINYNLYMESFCDIARSPSVYSKITIVNPCGRTVSNRISIMLRCGDEPIITGSDDDGYSPYINDTAPWYTLPCEAGFNNGVMTEQGCRLCVTGEEFVSGGEGLCYIDYTLLAGQSLEFYTSFGENAPESFDYEEKRTETEQFWLSELSAIKHRPNNNDEELQAIYTNLVTQCLQFFCCPRGKDYVLPRQGSMQRLIWPSETMPMFEALIKAGDFGKYMRPAIDTYFDVLQEKDGENVGMITNFGIPWASVTGACLYAFAVYTIYSGDRVFFEKHREAALSAVGWIERTRAISTADKNLVDGLFPPMRSCDYEVPSAQSWGITDLYNLDGYRRLREAFIKFDGEGKEQVIAADESYRSNMKSAIDTAITRFDGVVAFTMPVDPKDELNREEFFRQSVAPRRESVTPTFLNIGLIDESGDIPERLEAGCRELGVMNRGLTWRLADHGVFKDGNLSYYGSTADRDWFLYYMRSNQHEKAKEVLDAQLKYIMTPEYYMMERYDETNPYYTPWLPNGSANGRTMLMLLEWYSKN